MKKTSLLKVSLKYLEWFIHPVFFRHEHPSILREAFLAMYRYVNFCKYKLISREHLGRSLSTILLQFLLEGPAPVFDQTLGENLKNMNKPALCF